MKTNRRDFIKISSAGAGGLLMAGPAFKMMNQDKSGAPVDELKVERTATYCEVCFWKCAGWVYKNEKGDIWKVVGNDDDPLCNGRLCPRGTGGIGMYHDEDRLKTPLIRRERDGKQVYEEASWNQAFDYIAKKMEKIKEKHGPESVALFNHGSGGKHFSTVLKGFGTTNITAPSYAQCKGPREAGFMATFGAHVGSPEPTDIRDTRCLVLIGSHIGENMHNAQIQEMSDAIDKGATIITVDPRFSTAASHSKFWLPIKPATDNALMLAWMHVLIYEDLYDKKYVEQYAYGFDQLKAHVKNFTPEWASAITTIEPDVIRKTAREMSYASPSVIIHPGRHTTWYGDDTQRTRAIAILNALLGSWGRRGGFYFPAKASAPAYPHPPYPKPKWSWKDFHQGKYPMADSSVANAIIDASHPDNDTDMKIKAWFVVGTNLIYTIPDSQRTIEALQNQDLVVVVDTMPMEITGYADVVLPECTYLERYDDLRISPFREPTVALRAPAAEPKYLSKPASWIARRLAIKLGIPGFANYEDFKDVLDWQLKLMGTSLAEMEKIGLKKLPREYDDLYLRDGEQIEFNTNTGKIELYSTELAALGFDPMPNYVAHPEPPQGFYRLNYGRAPMHTFSRTANNPNLTDLMDHNKLWVNPKVADQWGLKTGQEVWLKNDKGIISNFPIKVRVTERIRWDSVYMIHGFGHAKKALSRAFGKGIADTELMSNVHIDPIMGGTGMRGNFVTFVLENPGKEVES